MSKTEISIYCPTCYKDTVGIRTEYANDPERWDGDVCTVCGQNNYIYPNPYGEKCESCGKLWEQTSYDDQSGFGMCYNYCTNKSCDLYGKTF